MKDSREGRMYGEMRVEETMAAGGTFQKSTDSVDTNVSAATGYWKSTVCELDLIASYTEFSKPENKHSPQRPLKHSQRLNVNYAENKTSTNSRKLKS